MTFLLSIYKYVVISVAFLTFLTFIFSLKRCYTYGFCVWFNIFIHLNST